MLLLASALLLGGASALELNETAGPVVFPGAVPVFYQGLNGSKCYRCAALTLKPILSCRRGRAADLVTAVATAARGTQHPEHHQDLEGHPPRLLGEPGHGLRRQRPPPRPRPAPLKR